MRVAAAIVPAAVPRAAGRRRGRGRVRDGVAAARTATRCGRRCWRTGAATAATAAHVGDVLGRIHAATADRPDIAARFATDALFHAIRLDPYLVTAARATRISPRGCRAGGDHREHEARAGPRRLQPEEHPDRARRTGDPRRRMRVVRRSRVRPRVRAEPPVAQGRVAAAVARSTTRRCPPRCVDAYRAHVRVGAVAGARRARGGAAAGAAAGAHRRQVAGRVPDRATARGPRVRAQFARQRTCATPARRRWTQLVHCVRADDPDHRSIACTRAASGTRAGAPPSRRRCAWPSGVDRARHRAGRRVARLARSDRPARRRHALRRLRRGAGDRQRARADRARALRHGRARPGRHRRRSWSSSTARRTRRRLGGNATVAVSLAVAHAAALAHDMPLWQYLAGDDPVSLPLPEIQIFGGGAHAGRRIDIQDLMVMPVGAWTFADAIGDGRRGLSRGGRADARAGQARRRRRRRRLVAAVRVATRRRWR